MRGRVAIAGASGETHLEGEKEEDRMKTLIVFLLSLMVAAPVLAGPPADGTYKSTDIGGVMLTGTYSETWVGGKMSAGNTVNEASWDGSTLGSQWKWYCAHIAAAPILLYNGVNGTTGNGQKLWQVTYTGGMAWLDGAGPWAGGDAFYEATVDTWVATVTEQYSNFVEVGTVKTVNATASFVNYPDACIVLALSNLEKHGDGETLPTDDPLFTYPDLTGRAIRWGRPDRASGERSTTSPIPSSGAR